MAKEKQSVLFVSHVADRNGAPLILLGIIKEFKKLSNIPFRILLMEDGDLTPAFKETGTTYIWKKRSGKRPQSLPARLFAWLGKFAARVRHRYLLFQVRDTTLVFFNTIVNGHIHEKLLFLKGKYVCYVHELGAAIHSQTNMHTLGVVLNHTDFFLTGSEAVKNNLTRHHGLDQQKVKVVYSSIPDVCREKEQYSDFITSFKNRHNIPPGAVVIGLAASNEWRKGFDLLLPLARLYFNLYPGSDVYFVWKGFREKNKSGFYDLYDYKKFNLQERVLLLPHDGFSIEQMACFDIHLLLSREDPYPLVVLEAASFGIPTVCFADGGGSPEFIESDSGYCVPYGDLFKMAGSLHELAENTSLRMAMGKKAQEKVTTRHSQQKATMDVIEVIEKIL